MAEAIWRLSSRAYILEAECMCGIAGSGALLACLGNILHGA